MLRPVQEERVLLMWDKFSEKSRIIIKGFCSLEFTDIGLEIRLEDNCALEDHIVRRYALTPAADSCCMTP